MQLGDRVVMCKIVDYDSVCQKAMRRAYINRQTIDELTMCTTEIIKNFESTIRCVEQTAGLSLANDVVSPIAAENQMA